jgi:hypothetical protein
VSRAKRTRAKERRQAELRGSPVATPGAQPSTRTTQVRLRPVRRRARLAKGLLSLGGTLAFAASMLFARASFAGHPKHPPRPLAAPPRFLTIVRENLLQAGIVAPAQAPPDAATSVS